MKRLYILLILVIFLSCSHLRKAEAPAFFRLANNDAYTMFNIDSISKQNATIGYKMSFLVRDSTKRHSSLPGFIYMNGTVLLFRFDYPPNDTIKLFDFGLKVGEEDNIFWDLRFPQVRKDYKLRLEDKFYYQTYRDTVYYFIFKNFGIGEAIDNIHLFVLKDYGIVGDFVEVIQDTIKDYRGRIVDRKGNVFEDVIDYSKFTYGALQ